MAAWLAAVPFVTVFADAQSDRRVLVGLKIFPAVVAADQDLAAKVKGGRLRLLIVSYDPRENAHALAERLRSIGKLREFPLDVLTVTYAQLAEYKGPAAGVFLADWAPDEIGNVIRFGRKHNVITFSPFKGDVAKGIISGLFISDRILPLVNIDEADAASIRLKPFFLQIAREQKSGKDE